MKKTTMAFITATAILGTVACAKKSAKTPAAKPDAKVSSAAELDAARAKKEADEKARKQGLNPASPRTDRTSPGMYGSPNKPPAAQPPRDSAPAITDKLSETYAGPLLVIEYPNDSQTAWIPVQNEDAKAIYNALRLKTKTYAENDVFLPGKVKSGENIRCFLQFEKSAPDLEAYSCNIRFGYSTGEVEGVNADVQSDFDDTVPPLKEKYSGISVMLKPGTVNIPAFDPSAEMKITGDGFGAANAKDMLKVHGEPIGRLKLTGNDARAFFNLMKIPVSNGLGSETVTSAQKKVGQHITCFKYQAAAKTEPDFRCDISFNYSNGRVLQVSSPRLPETSDTNSGKPEAGTDKPNLLDPNAIVSGEGE